MDKPDFLTLRLESEQEWLTHGPNSGGVSGLMLARGKIWVFHADFTYDTLEPDGLTPAEFLAKHGDSTKRGYAEALAWIRNQEHFMTRINSLPNPKTARQKPASLTPEQWAKIQELGFRSIAELARAKGLPPSTLRHRLKRGMTVEAAIPSPPEPLGPNDYRHPLSL